MRVIDQLTIERIEELQAEAEVTGQQVDWEAGKLIPRKYAGMSPHQRDVLAQIETRKQHRRDIDKDNDSANPEQADWERA